MQDDNYKIKMGTTGRIDLLTFFSTRNREYLLLVRYYANFRLATFVVGSQKSAQLFKNNKEKQLQSCIGWSEQQGKGK